MESRGNKNGGRHRYAWLIRGLAIATIVYLAFVMATRTPYTDNAGLQEQARRADAAKAKVNTGESSSPGDRQITQSMAGQRTPLPTVAQGDVEKATAKFLDTSRCIHARRVAKSLRKGLDSCYEDKDHTEFFARCSKITATYSDDIARLERESADCEANQTIVEDSYFDAVLRAAKLGNVDAQLCLVASEFHLSMPWSDEERERYRELARTYVDAAIKRGDWRIAQLLSTGYRGFGKRDLLRSVTTGDRLAVYRMNRLKRHGAVGEYARILDVTATNPQAPFPADEAKAAEDWALETYRLYFSRSAPLTADPVPCAATSRFP